MTDTLTTAKSLVKQTIGGNDNTWGTSLNSTLDLIDKALGQTLSKSISGDTTLSSADAQYSGVTFIGTLSAMAAVTWPAFSGPLRIKNGTSGSYAITCGLATGATVRVSSGGTAWIWSDGASFVQIGNDVGFGINVADHGATGDGTTDDTAAIQAANDQVHSAGGGIVFLPAGTYIVGTSAALTIDNNVYFVGAGTGATRLKLAPNSSFDVLRTRDVITCLPQSTSASTVTVPTPSATAPSNISFTVSGGLGFVVGQPVQASTYNASFKYATGAVVSYSGTTLTMSVKRGITGAASVWYITQVGNTIISDGTSGKGPCRWGLRDLTIDGNATNNTVNFLAGRGIYSYSQGVTLENVNIVECQGSGWEQHQALAWNTTANDTDGIVRSTHLSINRCEQRRTGDMPGGIGGAFFDNGPTDSRHFGMLVGWCEGAASIKIGPNGAMTIAASEVFGGGYPDGLGRSYFPLWGIINESVTSRGFIGLGTNISGGTTAQVLCRTNGFVLRESYCYLLVGGNLSSTSLAIGTGAKTLTTETGMGYQVGQYVAIYDTATRANSMTGTVTSYDSATGVLVTNITAVTGSGTKTSWSVGPAFQQGGIWIGDHTNGYDGATGVVIDAYFVDVLGPVITFNGSGGSSSPGFGSFRIRGYTNWADPATAISGTPDDTDELDIWIDGSSPVISQRPHGVQYIYCPTTNVVLAGATSYVGPAGIDANNSSVGSAAVVAHRGYIQGMRVFASGGPVGGETYVYTVLINSVPQTLTATLTGASTDTGNVTSNIAVAAGSLVCLRVVASAGATAAEHTAVIELAH